MVLSSLAMVQTAKLHWSITVLTTILGIQFLAQVRALDGKEPGKAAGKLFQWSITYLSAFSLALVIGALFLNP